MFHRIAESEDPKVKLTLDGRPISALAGDSVAVALLANGVLTCRKTPVSGAPRAPFCLMGVCFECLVVIDGIGSRQACLTPVREGMRVETQGGRANRRYSSSLYFGHCVESVTLAPNENPAPVSCPLEHARKNYQN